MKKLSQQQIINIIITLIVLTVNYLATSLPLNGLDTGEISDQFDIYFVPAGYVFSIWGIIYLGLIAFAIYQALPAQRDNPRLQRIGYLYALANLANAVWLFLWHYEVFSLTVLAMLTILGSLITLYLKLDIGGKPFDTVSRWTVQIPFSIYLGWISVATVANISQTLYFWEWNGWGIAPEIWTIIMLIVAASLALLNNFTRKDVAYSLVFVWAYIGIAVEHSNTSTVAIPAAILATLIFVALFVREPILKAVRPQAAH